MKLVVGYPTVSDEEEIVRRMASDPPQPRQLLDPAQIIELQEGRGPRSSWTTASGPTPSVGQRHPQPRRPRASATSRPYLDLGGSPRGLARA